MWWFTIKCCTILWLVDPCHIVLHHKVLYPHVTGCSLPYGYSPKSAVLSCDWVIPTTVYGYSLSSAVLSCDRLIPTIQWFTIKCCTIKCLADPYHMVIHHQVLCSFMWWADTHLMVIHHQVLYYHVTSWSPLHGDSPSSSVCSCDWLIPTIWWFTIKCCTYDMSAWFTLFIYHDSLSCTELSRPNVLFCENVCSKLGTNFPLFLTIIKHLMSYLLVNV